MMPDPINASTNPVASPLDNWLTAPRFAAALALLIFAVFPGVVSGTSSFIFKDFGLFSYPLADYFRESFWRGEIPLWNPLNNCGLPFLAQWNTMVCYPGSVVYLVLPLPWSLNLFCLLHLFLAGNTMYFLALRWTGNRLAASAAGLAFAFSGAVLGILMWPNYIAVLAWMPAVILCSERAWVEGGRRLILAGLVGAMQMLAGTPELILFTWLIVLVLWVDEWWRKTVPRHALVRRFVAVVALVAGLSAVQLLPFLDLLLHSHRSIQSNVDAWSLPFSGLANYLVPLFRTYHIPAGVHLQQDQYCLSSTYSGIGVLGLALCALAGLRQRRVWLLGGLLLASLWLSLGDKGILYGWLQQGFPGANFMRYPVKCALVGALLFPLLAAIGITECMAASPTTERTRTGRRLLVWPALALCCAVIVAFAFVRPLHETDGRDTLQSALARLLFLGLFATSMWGIGRFRSTKARTALALALLALVVLDTITLAPSLNPTAPPSVFGLKVPILEQMDPRPALAQSRASLSPQAQHRFTDLMLTNQAENYLVRRMGLFANCNLLDRMPKVNGFYALYLPHERDVLYRLHDSAGVARPNLANFLGISQETSKDDLLHWNARTNYLPLVTAGQRPVFLDSITTLSNLTTESFNPRETVFLPMESRPRLNITNRSACRILSSRVTAQCVAATVDATQPALVVIAQVDYHPWHATVDGITVPIHRANHAFQAVEVPAGKHEVLLAYRDRAFQAGLFLTALTLLTGAASWCRMRPVSGNI